MSLLLVSEPAYRDLQTIWSTISSNNLGAADRVTDALVHRFKLLAEFPRMGRERPELAPELRSFPVGNYLIFYKLIVEGVEILRVLHGSRDLPTLFGMVKDD